MNSTKYNPNGADVAIIMGSKSDWPTMKWAAEILDKFSVSHESLLVSAHRTPNRLADFASSAQREGFKVIIAGTAYAAHLPGMTASFTDLPVIGVPIESRSLKGMDSLLSIVQMPKGIPVATCAIGEAGAMNAGILAAKILGISDVSIRKKVSEYRMALERDYAPALGSLP